MSDIYIRSEYIFNKLNEKGAGLGNASLFIIREALRDLDNMEVQKEYPHAPNCALRQSLVADCNCGWDDGLDEAIIGSLP